MRFPNYSSNLTAEQFRIYRNRISLEKLSRSAPAIFTGLEWGTDRVFEATLQKLNTLSFQIHVLPEWRDVDEPDDLAALRARLEGRGEDVAVHTRATLNTLSYYTNFTKGDNREIPD